MNEYCVKRHIYTRSVIFDIRIRNPQTLAPAIAIAHNSFTANAKTQKSQGQDITNTFHIRILILKAPPSQNALSSLQGRCSRWPRLRGSCRTFIRNRLIDRRYHFIRTLPPFAMLTANCRAPERLPLLESISHPRHQGAPATGAALLPSPRPQTPIQNQRSLSLSPIPEPFRDIFHVCSDSFSDILYLKIELLSVNNF